MDHPWLRREDHGRWTPELGRQTRPCGGDQSHKGIFGGRSLQKMKGTASLARFSEHKEEAMKRSSSDWFFRTEAEGRALNEASDGVVHASHLQPGQNFCFSPTLRAILERLRAQAEPPTSIIQSSTACSLARSLATFGV